MALTTTVTPAMVAVAMGQAAPDFGSTKEAQWEYWIDSALMLVQVRVDSFDPVPTVDQAKLDYVIREAVVAQARRPDDAAQVTVSVDDGSTSKTYRTSAGRVTILDDWWAMLGLAPSGGGAYSIDTVDTTTTHLAWCSLSLGALYCSCGADIAGYPIYEGGGFW
jgi:hypothetical protein